MHDPCERHRKAVYRILRYLKSCLGRGLLFSHHKHLKVEVYSNADWAGSIDDRRSISSHCTFIGGNLVTWHSKKSDVVARSSEEAEYRAMAQDIYEVLWLKQLLIELHLFQSSSLFLFCDNKAAINIVNNPIQHD